MQRRGWIEREPYRTWDGPVPSYDLRLSDDHWVTVHATTPPTVVLSPMGINLDRREGYDSLDEAMEYAEARYRERLRNMRANNQAKAAEADVALEFFDESVGLRQGVDSASVLRMLEELVRRYGEYSSGECREAERTVEQFGEGDGRETETSEARARAFDGVIEDLGELIAEVKGSQGSASTGKDADQDPMLAAQSVSG